MNLGRHTEKAVVKHQERGAKWSEMARTCLVSEYFSHSVVIFMQRTAEMDNATARKLMGVE